MNLKRKISFIIPLFNAQQFIIKCIDSCLKQASDNLDVEVIVVDDGSTDDSARLVKAVANSDKRVILISQSNQGVSVARNNGMEKATGDYIMFVDSDDYLSPDSISLLIRIMDENEIDLMAHGGIVEDSRENMVHSNQVQIKFSSVQSGIDFIRDNEGPYKKEQVSGAWGFIIRKNNISDNTRFIEGLPFGEDSLFFLKLILESSAIVSTSYKFYHYVQHPGSVMHKSHSIESIADATLTRCIENRKIIDLMNDEKEIQEIIRGRLISIAFSRLFLRILKNKNEIHFGSKAISMFKCYGLWPLPPLPKQHSPYIGKKAMAYSILSNKNIYRIALLLRKIV